GGGGGGGGGMGGGRRGGAASICHGRPRTDSSPGPPRRCRAAGTPYDPAAPTVGAPLCTSSPDDFGTKSRAPVVNSMGGVPDPLSSASRRFVAGARLFESARQGPRSSSPRPSCVAVEPLGRR